MSIPFKRDLKAEEFFPFLKDFGDALERLIQSIESPELAATVEPLQVAPQEEPLPVIRTADDGDLFCDECGGTGWRERESDSAPVQCVFCEVLP